jgi:hypothetical protein
MIDEPMSIVAITRSLGYTFGCLRLLYVSIDGQWVGKVWGNRTKEFPVTPGEHLITVALGPQFAASLPVRIERYDRVELICTTDAVQLHPWHVHCLWFCWVFFFVLYPLGAFIPSIRALLDKLVVEMMIVLVMGVIGTTIFCWRVYKAGPQRPTMYLTSALDLDEGGGERCN